MAGYTRTDTANNIANGNVINANDIDAEYNAVEAAFNASSGHKHDGTAAEGAPITRVGPAADLIVSGSSVLPKTGNTLDLGSNGVQFKDAYFDGVLYADSSRHGVNGLTSIADNVYAVSSGGFTLDVDGDITLDPTGLDVILATTGTPYGALTNTNNNLTIKSGTTTAITLTGANAALAGTLGVAGNSTIGGTLGVTGAITGALTGNASTASALSATRTITLGGDLNGTINFNGSQDVSVTVGVNDDSHNHTQANVDGLVAALSSINSTNSSQQSSISSINSTLGGKVANTRNISAGAGLAGGGNLAADRTISHADTSSQGSVDNSGQSFIQDITLDTYGHITSISSATASGGSSGLAGDGTEAASFTTLEGNFIRRVNNAAPSIKADALSNTQAETPFMLGSFGSGYFVPKSTGSNGTGITYNNGTGNLKILSGSLNVAVNQTGGILRNGNDHQIFFMDDAQSNGGAGNKEIRFKVSGNNFISMNIEAQRVYFRVPIKVDQVSSTAIGVDTTGIVRGVSFSSTSDYRLKENVDYTWDATTRLKQLKPARYNWISDETNTLVDGFIAHEVGTVLPDAVHGAKDGEEMQSLDYSKIIPLLVKTVQELEARIVALEA